MADNDVELTIGAKIDQLIAAVDESKSHIESIKGSVETAGESFKKLGEIIGIAFSVEAMKQFVETMAELGEQTEIMMARLGLSADAVVNLSGVAKLTGSSIEGMSLAIERMSLGVQRSTADALGPQAQALKVLGLNAKDLIGIPADEYFSKLADAVSKFNPSLNLTNALMILGGRGVQQMIPALRLGAEGFKQMQDAVRQSQEGLAAAIPGMADTHNKLEFLSLSAQSLGARIFTVLKPAIDLIVTSMTKWIQSLDTKTIQDFAKALIETLGNAIIGLIGLFDELGASLDDIATKFKRVLAGAAIGGALGALGGPGGAAGGAIIGGGIVAAWDAFIASFNTGAEKAGRNLTEKQTELVARVKAMMKELSDAISGGASHGDDHGGGGGQNAAAINEGARASLEAQRARYETELSLLQQTLAKKKILYDLDAGLWKTSDDQKFASTMAATEAEFEQERATLQKIRDLWPAHSKEWEAENQKMVAATAKFSTEMVNLNAQSLLSMKSKWDEVFGSLQSSFNGQLRGLLAGTTTFTQAFRSIIGDMVIYFIQAIEKMVFQWLAGQAAQLFATQSTTGAKAAAEAAAAAETLPIRVASFTSAITADAALAFAGIFANLAPFLGPAAAGPAAAGEATVLAQLAAVPKFETGAWQVPSTMYAQIHKDEMIVPAGPAQAIRDGAKVGGGSPIHIHAIDAAGVADFIKTNAPALAVAVTNYQGRNRSTRPKW